MLGPQRGMNPKGRTTFHHLLPFRNSIAASAVCAFNLSAISRAFNGPFRYQENPRAAWLPIANPIPNFQVRLLFLCLSLATNGLPAAQDSPDALGFGVCDGSPRGW